MFGATLLGKDWAPSLPAWLAMRAFNYKGFFSNRQDDLRGLESALRELFKHTSVRMIGGMAVFTART